MQYGVVLCEGRLRLVKAKHLKTLGLARSQWFTPVVLAIWEAEIGRLGVGG
jgi:hypothetical protein